MGGNVNIDWGSLAGLKKDLVIRLRISKGEWEELEKLRDELMLNKVGESEDYVIADVVVAKNEEGRILVNFWGQMLALAMLAETVEQL